MKLSRKSLGRKSGTERGMAVIIVMALLAIILMYVLGNARTLDFLKRDIRIVEQHQSNRVYRAYVLPAKPPPGEVQKNNTERQK